MSDDTSIETPLEPLDEKPVIEQPAAILVEPKEVTPADDIKARARKAFDAIEAITGPNAEARHWLALPFTRDGLPTHVENLEAMLASLLKS